MKVPRRVRAESARTRVTRFDALSALVAAILAVFAPTLDAITCGCGHDEAGSQSKSCCDDGESASGHGAETPDSHDSDHPCPNRGDSCCCERAHDAVPPDGVTTVAAPHVAVAAPIAIEARFCCPSRILLQPFGRARCRDAPNIFVLNSLRL